MIATRVSLVLVAGVSLLASSAFALDIYPARGQSPAQQAADTAECQTFAKNQTGFDPQQALSSSQPLPQPEAVRPRKRAKEEKQAEQTQDAQTKQKMASYNKAESVCLKGKGYSVG
jgi:hypothetical protein